MIVRQIWRLWSIILVAEVVIVFFFNTTSQPKGAHVIPADTLAEIPTLADIPALADEAALAAARKELMATRLWGGKAKDASTKSGLKAKAPDWSLSGVFMKGSQRYVILLYAKGALPPQQLTVGDALPSDETIMEIERDKVLIQAKNKEERWVPINRTADAGQIILQGNQDDLPPAPQGSPPQGATKKGAGVKEKSPREGKLQVRPSRTSSRKK